MLSAGSMEWLRLNADFPSSFCLTLLCRSLCSVSSELSGVSSTVTGVHDKDFKDLHKNQLENMSCTNVATLCALCRSAPLAVTFTASSAVRIVAWVTGGSSSWGVHESTLPHADFSVSFFCSSPLTFSSFCCLPYMFSLAHRLSASGRQSAFFSLCWHRWTIAADYSLALLPPPNPFAWWQLLLF